MTAPNSTPAPESGKPRLVDRLGRPMKHGGSGTPEYSVWQHMLHRCYNPNSQRYDRYGARGIRVCERWRLSFEAFYADMGPRPSPGHSLDRKDNDGPYSPENCRWATRDEQNANRSDNVFLEHDGRRQTVAEWAKELGINPRTLHCRIESGMTPAEALTRPVASRRWTRSPGRKGITAEDKAEMRRLRAQGWTLNQIGERFGVSFSMAGKYTRAESGGAQ